MVSRVAIFCLLGGALAAAGCDRQSAPTGQAGSTAGATAPTAAGAVDRSHAGEAAPDATFQTGDGKKAALADFRGRPLLVNLWATWCAPCVKEMPTLDAAAGTFPGRVIAVSQDMEPAKATAFIAEHGFTRLQAYLDPELALSTAYGANLPTTILYGADGREIWRVAGELDWTGEKARTLLAEANRS